MPPREGKAPENLVLVRQIAALLREYAPEEVEQLVARHLAAAQSGKQRPRGRTAPKPAGR